MDQPSKKRSIFGLGSLFQRSSASTEPESKTDTPTQAAVPILQRPNFNNASAPESPVKRASESQMASRKIIGRPQGPSSKLSQSVSASDLARVPTSNAVATPRRMPGDNPNKPSVFSNTLVSRGPSTDLRSTNFAGGGSAPRSNIFRSSALYSRPAPPNFSSSRAASSAANQSFPPNTPGRTVRGSTAELIGRVPPQGNPDDLFKMRIQSPPRHLTGEMLAKEVPDDLTRSGSVYADEFLTHYCPPDFNKQQRDQFFCILDLRRLKYAADEVFTKKDWRINVLNFAKEYEKSRSLIMLRYGLYEFKTVRPSEAVKKDWKDKHGVPDSDDEGEPTPKTNGTISKRKASEELTPASVALATSVSSGNKRTRPLEVSAKNKRKADVVGEPDENHPSKLQKAAPTPQKAPSATKSVFEKIANTPAKSGPPASLFASSTSAPPASLFASGTTAKSSGRSVFESASKPASSLNIFGHLSDASKNSGNEGADEDSETGSEADEEDESEMPDADASPSDEQTSSGEATESFTANKPLANGTSSSSSDAGESTQGSAVGRSLFDRITRAPDGQPMRKLPPPEARSRSVSPIKEASAPAPAPAPVAAPTNNTWNANTPIKFGGPASGSLFGQKPAAPAKESAAPVKETPSNLFGTVTKNADEPASSEATKAPATNLFGGAAKSTETAPAASLFGASKPAGSAGSSLFGSPAPAAAPATKVVFGDKPISVVSDAKAVSAFDPSAMFGPNKKDVAPAGNIFAKTETPAAAATKPAATTLFGTDASKSSSGSLFGAAPAATAFKASVAEEPAANKFAFGGADAKSTTTSLFGSNASTPAPEGAKPAETKSLFGAAPAAPATETKNLFGGAATATPAPASSLFGAPTAAPATEAKTLFGSASTAGSQPLFGSAPAAESKTLFGSTPAVETKPLFGSTPAAQSQPLFGSTPAAETKPLFGSTPAPETKSLFGSSSAAESKPLFGSAAQTDKPIFGSNSQEGKGMFGSTIQPDSKPPASLFASSATPAPAAAPASNMFSFGASQASAPTTQSFTFGSSQAPASQPATQSGGSIFGIGAGAGTSFDFSVGGNSASTSFNNPFSSGQDASQATALPTSFTFGNNSPAPGSQSFTFGSNGGNTAAASAPVPTFSFGGASDTSASGNVPPSGVFSFGGGSQNPPAAPIFGSSLAPGGGTSTGTNTPFTFGGASSLATTPAATTPEASANVEDGQGTNADGDDAPQEQISLTEGGRGEEDEDVVHEIRTKALKFVVPDDDDESGSGNNKGQKKGEWAVKGVGTLRLLKHKTTGTVRVLLRGEPRGHIALNKRLLPDLTYKVEPPGGKYVKMSTATDNGKALESWMLQVKTPDFAKALAGALEENKKANAKK